MKYQGKNQKVSLHHDFTAKYWYVQQGPIRVKFDNMLDAADWLARKGFKTGDCDICDGTGIQSTVANCGNVAVRASGLCLSCSNRQKKSA